jgi:7-keto-8-aminopelargonate synthetase-like enzyme
MLVMQPESIWNPTEPGPQIRLDGHVFDDFATPSRLGFENTFDPNEAKLLDLHRFAFWLGLPRAWVYPHGTAIVQHPFARLFRSDDLILCAHQSSSALRSLARISLAQGAKIRWFDLHQVDDLERLLLQHRSSGRKIIMLPSLDPATNSPAPLQQLHLLTIRHQSWMYVDETVALGSYGRLGRGIARDQLGPWEHLLIGGSLQPCFGWGGQFLASSAMVGQYVDVVGVDSLPNLPLPHDSLLPSVIEPRLCYLREIADHVRSEGARIGIPFWGQISLVKELHLGNPGDVERRLLDQYIRVRRRSLPPYLQPTAGDILSIQLSAQHTPAQIDHLLVALDRCQLQPMIHLEADFSQPRRAV